MFGTRKSNGLSNLFDFAYGTAANFVVGSCGSAHHPHGAFTPTREMG